MSGEFPANRVYSISGFFGPVAKLLGGFVNVIGASVRLNAASQATVNNTFAPVTWDTIDFDTNSFFNIGSPTVLTVPFTGLYIVTASINWQPNATGTRSAEISVNGSTTVRKGQSAITAHGTDNVSNSVSTILSLNAGDTVSVRCAQDSGGGLNIVGSNSSGTFLSIMGFH